jgi:hypothetical protein
MMKRMHHDTITYRAAVAIFDQGAMPVHLLNAHARLGGAPNIVYRNLERAIETGWLEMDRDGIVSVTEIGRRQIMEDREEAKRVLIAEPVPPRQVNLLHRPEYKPAKRVVRQDVPDWSKRPDGFSFHTVA